MITTFDGIVFAMLAVVGVVRASRYRDGASLWFAATFVLLAAVVAAGAVDSAAELIMRISLAALALVPWGLYRFARTIVPGRRALDRVTLVLTLVILGWTCFVDLVPEGADWTPEFAIYAVAFLVHWAVLLGATGWLLVRESRRTSGIARRRLRLFASAAITLALVLVLTGVPQDSDAGRVLQVGLQLAGAVAAIGFWFALVPPTILRAWWRSREFSMLQSATSDLLAGDSVEDVRDRVVVMARELTGARSAVLLDPDTGDVLASTYSRPADAQRVAVRMQCDGAMTKRRSVVDRATGDGILQVGRIAVVVGRATPFFGVEERRILQVLDRVEQLVEERAGVLEREREATRRLRDVDELKNEFVAMVAHDLRSPMAVISGFADTIADRWDEFDDARKLEFLGLISRNAHSLAGFVEDVLQVARLDSGALAYRTRPFDARSVVERVANEVRMTHPDLGIELRVPDDVPQALGDEDRQWQILTNLVGNAVKYTTAEHPQVCVDIEILPGGRELAIAITDNGIGIAEEDQERLFRRFSRVGDTRRSFEGTGLGLYIVKSMVEAQGGRIWVSSALGEGSTFTYTVPVAAGDCDGGVAA